MASDFVMNDGGRAAAGFTGKTRDCVCRSIAIVTGMDYRKVYDALNELGAKERKGSRKSGKSNARTGVYAPTIRKFMASLGWRWVPTMAVGSGCMVHLNPAELPTGRLLVSVSKHMTAMIDGVLHDNHDPRRDGTRCVYGYYVKG